MAWKSGLCGVCFVLKGEKGLLRIFTVFQINYAINHYLQGKEIFMVSSLEGLLRLDNDWYGKETEFHVAASKKAGQASIMDA